MKFFNYELSTIDESILALVGSITLFTISSCTFNNGINRASPKRVYHNDFDNDGLADILVESEDGRSLFLAREYTSPDGRNRIEYFPFNEDISSRFNSSRDSVFNYKNSVQKSIDSFMKRVEVEER